MRDDEALAAIQSALDGILTNKPIGTLGLPPQYTQIEEKLLQLQTLHTELQAYSVKLSKGDVEATPPSRKNYLAAGLKQLQAQIRHLIWQAQCVAEGDYNQQVDFMGEFAQAFNRMIAQLKEREGKIHAQQEFMLHMFDRIEPIVVVEEENRSNIIYANYLAKQRFAINEKAGTHSTLLAEILTLSADEHEHHIYDHASGRWFSVTPDRLPWSNQDSVLLFYCVDITAHKERENDLETAANTDLLTGIYNRRAFEHTLRERWELCDRIQKPLSIIMFDIDHFKEYNDSYGHIQGDACLSFFATTLLKGASRADDVVARYGGEEFIVILPFTEEQNAMRVAETMRQSVEEGRIEMQMPDGGVTQTSITVSGGVSTVIPGKAFQPAQLVQAADEALYEAKQSGRNQIRYRAIGC